MNFSFTLRLDPQLPSLRLKKSFKQYSIKSGPLGIWSNTLTLTKRGIQKLENFPFLGIFIPEFGNFHPLGIFGNFQIFEIFQICFFIPGMRIIQIWEFKSRVGNSLRSGDFYLKEWEFSDFGIFSSGLGISIPGSKIFSDLEIYIIDITYII